MGPSHTVLSCILYKYAYIDLSIEERGYVGYKGLVYQIGLWVNKYMHAYCTILYCIILHCIILHCTAMHIKPTQGSIQI